MANSWNLIFIRAMPAVCVIAMLLVLYSGCNSCYRSKENFGSMSFNVV